MASRRNFLKHSGLSFLPAFLPALPAAGSFHFYKKAPARPVNFVSDGELTQPKDYISKLKEIEDLRPIEGDVYGNGGVVDALQKKFQSVTGKERAIFMPTGTMANQLAIAVLSGENTKVFVQETSHVYRDEADAAQSVHNKRLIPLAKEETGFTMEELKASVDYHMQGEVFKSGIGAISIENPVRRTSGRRVDMEEIKKISTYCKKNGYKLHLDGARIFLASAYSGISVKEYSSYFDTVYISLYKYFGAAGGAILCGEGDVIGKMVHLIKVHGGTMYEFWPQAAMALHNLEGFEQRIKEAADKANDLFASLNSLPEIKINPLKNGTNIFDMKFAEKVSGKKFSETMSQKHGITISGNMREGVGRITVNESVLHRDNKDLLASFKDALNG
jgi:threonine aldolase